MVHPTRSHLLFEQGEWSETMMRRSVVVQSQGKRGKRADGYSDDGGRDCGVISSFLTRRGRPVARRYARYSSSTQGS